ncbi:hypothetical protein NIES267_47620 [Calothrix parasitica NIES-267]|uniref:Uncharacterized protein n=1 Tax=Calothrix parasitica NIES-267 TaxID=1973488 RepID=A0A1Z4LVM3_9CYAN|nr:hypothetical protein NIES267_47620 [Calothrix parasitica NIES-267]
MSKILQRFKNWIFESRSFLFSWYSKDRNQIQEPVKSLIELPPDVINKLVAATEKLSDNPTDTEAIRSCINEAFEEWRNCPKSAENSIVILTSPVMVVSRIVIKILEDWATNKQVNIRILPWNARPSDPDSIQSQLQQYIEQEAKETTNEQIEVMVIPNLSWCFLRSMDGLDGIDYLQKMLLHDSSRFWIIATGQISWDYLNSISDIEADCGRVSSLRKLESNDLKSWLQPIISELNITFANPRLESQILEGDKDNETTYFEDLISVSRGVSVIALQAFLASISYEIPDEGNQKGILQAQSPELPNLPELESADHYILYFLLLHGDITLPALAYSIGDSESKVRKRIKFLRSQGLIKEQNEILKVNSIYYPKLKQELLNNNFVINEFD